MKSHRAARGRSDVGMKMGPFRREANVDSRQTDVALNVGSPTSNATSYPVARCRCQNRSSCNAA